MMVKKLASITMVLMMIVGIAFAVLNVVTVQSPAKARFGTLVIIVDPGTLEPSIECESIARNCVDVYPD